MKALHPSTASIPAKADRMDFFPPHPFRSVRGMAALAAPPPGKTAAQLKLEKKLLGWLEAHSVQDIFDWFDCIQTTTVETPAGHYRWSTESVSRDRLFLTLLGLTQPVS